MLAMSGAGGECPDESFSGCGGDGERPGDTLYCLSYVSTQRVPLGHDELLAMLEMARRNNEMQGITGLLLHRAGSFFQILEGAQDVVLRMFEKIRADSRHERVEVVSEGAISERQFSDWKMAFVDLEDQDLSALPGFSDLLNNKSAARGLLRDLPRSRKLALLFTIMD